MDNGFQKCESVDYDSNKEEKVNNFFFQLPERAMFQIKQDSPMRNGVSEWQLEEAQVFWAKKEESLALSILKKMIKKLDEECFMVMCCILLT